ncbi:MAG: glycosyltransferase, partial [Anaerolineaceae bacterium]|nr:glycosyltransferase [Anaerolineaceae bacterium]
MVPKLEGLGGTASFQARLMEGLARRSMGVTFDLHDESAGVILVVGGTRHFNDLIAAKKRGAMIVQRLDGINWIHRRIYTGIRHFLKAEINNRTIAHIRRNLADRIVYQSHFVKDWWAKRYGDQDTPSYVIHNGVDLTIYNPKGPGGLPKGLYRLLLVEGRLGGGLHMGLENAVDLTRRLQNHHHLPVSLRVVGEVPERLKMKVDLSAGIPIEWRGVVERSRIPELDRSAHLLFSGDINAACPNAVIEALAC